MVTGGVHVPCARPLCTSLVHVPCARPLCTSLVHVLPGGLHGALGWRGGGGGWVAGGAACTECFVRFIWRSLHWRELVAEQAAARPASVPGGARWRELEAAKRDTYRQV